MPQGDGMNREKEEITFANLKERKILTLPPNINFGLEIELNDVDFSEVERLIENHFDGFCVHTDQSLGSFGAEVATPVLQNTKETWNILKKISKTLNHVHPSFKNASFQVTFDVDSDEFISKFLKFFMVYEDIVYRFSLGFDTDFRESINTYALPIRPFIIEEFVTKQNLKNDESRVPKCLKDSKRCALSFKVSENSEGQMLLEFRTPNGTIDMSLWQNYVTTFYAMMNYVKSKQFDEEKIDAQIEEIFYHQVLPYSFVVPDTYKEINLEKALEFSNLIFKQELDKLYFLKQYLGKDYEKIQGYQKKKIS